MGVCSGLRPTQTTSGFPSAPPPASLSSVCVAASACPLSLAAPHGVLPQGLQPPGFVCWPRWAPDPPLMMRGCTRKPSLQWPGWAPDPCCRHACCCCARCRICSPLTAHCAPSSPRAAARPSSRPRLLRPVAVFGAPLALNPNHPVGGGKPGGVHSHLPRPARPLWSLRWLLSVGEHDASRWP